MSAIPEQAWTPETYLVFERASDEKHEYLGGSIYAMAGASARHNQILGNALASLHSQLRDRPCIVYPSDMRVKVSRTGLYTYPDLSVVCGESRFEDDHEDTLLNPILIVEVLSPSTESYDRGKKFQQYRSLESLQEYLLISQDGYHVEQYVRQADDRWLLADVTDLDSALNLPSIACTLALADVYAKITFEDDRSSKDT
jgi:Uma2 family endonuclease